MNGLEFIIMIIGLVALGLLLKHLYSLRQKSQKAQTKASSLEDEVTRLWTTQSELSSEAQRLQREVDRLVAENLDLKRNSDIPKPVKPLRVDHLTPKTNDLDLETYHDYLKQAITEAENQKKALETEIIQLKQSVDLWQEEYRKIEAQHDEIVEYDQRLKAYPNLIQQQEDLLHRIDSLEQEKTHLTEHLRQAQAQIERDLQGLHRIKIVSACRHHSAGHQELFHAKLTLNFNRVREALDFAETMFDDILEIWDSARLSADASNFIRPDDTYRALQSLAWFGQYYFKQNGTIGNNIYYVLRE
jgi:DNA repair exonuclease SbcCD ATPase subunit